MDNYSLSAGPCMYGFVIMAGRVGVHTGKNDAHTQSRTRARPRDGGRLPMSIRIPGALERRPVGDELMRNRLLD